jgi:hypothetical protein
LIAFHPCDRVAAFLGAVHGDDAGRHEVCVGESVGDHFFVDGVCLAIDLARDEAGVAVARHVAHGVLHASFGQGFELGPMWVRGHVRIGELERFGHYGAVFGPERIAVGERRRRMTQANHHGQVGRLEAVATFVAVEVVVGEPASLTQARIGQRVEKQAVLAWDLIEPVVLCVACRLPPRVLRGGSRLRVLGAGVCSGEAESSGHRAESCKKRTAWCHWSHLFSRDGYAIEAVYSS